MAAAKRPAGRPVHKPTSRRRGEVSALTSYGVPQDEIARHLGIDAKTLRKHYRDELDCGALRRNQQVAKFLFENATGKTIKDGASHSDCVRAAIFWAKTRMGFRESSQLDHTSSDGSMNAPTRIIIEGVAPNADSDTE